MWSQKGGRVAGLSRIRRLSGFIELVDLMGSSESRHIKRGGVLVYVGSIRSTESVNQ